jgi:hypothetical protein
MACTPALLASRGLLVVALVLAAACGPRSVGNGGQAWEENGQENGDRAAELHRAESESGSGAESGSGSGSGSVGLVRAAAPHADPHWDPLAIDVVTQWQCIAIERTCFRSLDECEEALEDSSHPKARCSPFSAVAFTVRREAKEHTSRPEAERDRAPVDALGEVFAFIDHQSCGIARRKAVERATGSRRTYISKCHHTPDGPVPFPVHDAYLPKNDTWKCRGLRCEVSPERCAKLPGDAPCADPPGAVFGHMAQFDRGDGRVRRTMYWSSLDACRSYASFIWRYTGPGGGTTTCDPLFVPDAGVAVAPESVGWGDAWHCVVEIGSCWRVREDAGDQHWRSCEAWAKVMKGTCQEQTHAYALSWLDKQAYRGEAYADAAECAKDRASKEADGADLLSRCERVGSTDPAPFPMVAAVDQELRPFHCSPPAKGRSPCSSDKATCEQKATAGEPCRAVSKVYASVDFNTLSFFHAETEAQCAAWRDQRRTRSACAMLEARH